MSDLVVGLYDLLHTKALQAQLENAGLLGRAEWEALEREDVIERLERPLARELIAFIVEVASKHKEDSFVAALRAALDNPEQLRGVLDALKPVKAQALKQIHAPFPAVKNSSRPDTPLAASALLTGSSRSPALRTQLIKELNSCDRADWLVSFIKYSGILPLLPTLRAFTQQPTETGEPRLRVATTSYMGATDPKAIEALLDLPNTEVRVSYDTKRTRLHAKAYLFHRQTGFSSAYIGSANVSKAALDEGLEWTAKVSQYETEHLWRHAVATFESHWEDSAEFTVLTKDDLSEFSKALSYEKLDDRDKAETFGTTFFELRPYGYQQAILDDIAAEREANKHKHLVIAATGTGKTMIAAFDYKAYCSRQGGRPRLLFIAHREELLKQARATFRQVLRDGSFGDLVVSGATRTQDNHLFCTVQSWNSQQFEKFNSQHFDYVVLDEAHHAAASSYQKLIKHIKPNVLLGLTATPERNDGKSIIDDFGSAFTHEIRLPEAVERALLSPFHYYGIPDLDKIDFSNITWKRGGYDINELREKLECNEERALWVMGQTDKYVADIKCVRGLGFCVSVAHAEFMAEVCNDVGINAIALSAESSREDRLTAQQRLEAKELQFIFTVDLYNEGVDIPCVDTVLFLRPTESLTLFLQQLGRGLRLHEEKAQLTVLDFIAPQSHRFSFAKRFQALSSRPDVRIDKQIENGLPYVPSGCFIHLEEQAKAHVLKNIKEATANLRGKRLIDEIRELCAHTQEDITLHKLLDYLHLDSPDEVYKRGLPHVLIAEATGNRMDDSEKIYDGLSNGFRRFLLMDDTYFINDAYQLITTGTSNHVLTKSLLHTVLWGNKKPTDDSLEGVHTFCLNNPALLKDLKEMLEWLQNNRTPTKQNQLELTGPLHVHASYSREQVLLALGLGSFENPRSSREGVLHVPERKLDVFFADIHKSEADFSPTTMYDDYAITERLFHWQSQSQTSESSPVGERYIHHERYGYTPVLFIRNRKKLPNGLTAPYVFVGALKYKKHEGSKPISFTWELQQPLPAKVLAWARRIS